MGHRPLAQRLAAVGKFLNLPTHDGHCIRCRRKIRWALPKCSDCAQKGAAYR